MELRQLPDRAVDLIRLLIAGIITAKATEVRPGAFERTGWVATTSSNLKVAFALPRELFDLGRVLANV
ncbi:MAG: hypothetical protein Q7S35_04790, partial [Candidatus Limnocylindrales bacterium]|nr:hypothetical protein [Candidatus Limnocylindrales bacterium]